MISATSTPKTLVEVAFGRPSKRQPVWFLRQAGRYLPEYMAVRSKVDFVTLCKSPELASEVTLQPLRRFDLDAAIIFSDILIPCTAMGQTLSFDKGHGPQLSHAVTDAASLKALRVPKASQELGYVGEAIAKTVAYMRPDQTMIGFAGAPLTVATYMIEGCGSKDFTAMKRLRYSAPQVFRDLLEMLTETTVDYLSMQVKAGARALMLFDTWATSLIPQDYAAFALPQVKRICSEIKRMHPEVPFIYFPGQGSHLYLELIGLPCDVIAVDWRVRFEAAINLLSNIELDVTVQGNLDPQTLVAPRQFIEERVADIVCHGKKARGHIFNVGHGLLPHTPPDSLSWVIEKIRSLESGID